MAENYALSTTTQRKLVRFTEIAKAAGVSETTVDRVLNQRGSVSAKTRAKVLAAARSLSIPRILPDVWHGQCNIEVILPRSPMPFWRRVDDAIKNVVGSLPRNVVVHRTYIKENDHSGVAHALLQPRFPRAGVIIAAEINAKVREALSTLIARGEIMITIVTDVSSVANHVFCGIDNGMAGRTAAFLMGRVLPAKPRVLLMQGNDWFEAHRDRVAGFLQTMKDLRPNADIRIGVTRELIAPSHALLADALQGGPLDGIYDTGHTSAYIAPKLREMNRRPIWISHETDGDHRQLIEEGLMEFVLDQDPEGQVSAAFGCFLKQAGVGDPSTIVRAAELRVHCRYNLPPLPPI